MPKLLAKPLARWGDPYVTPTGAIVQPDSINGGVEVAPALNVIQYKPQKKRSTKDLPAPPLTINAIACVFMYTMLGLGDREIADTLKITTQKLEMIRKHSAYAECFEIVTGEFISINSEMIHARIAAYSHDALSSVAEIALAGKEEKNRLRGSIFIMGAGGFGNKVDQQRSVAQNDLRIVIINKEHDVRVEVDGGASVV
jgi:hypothetical protein